MTLFRYIKSLVVTLALLLALSGASQTWAQTVIRVDSQNGSASPGGLGNGWQSNAFLHLQDALAYASGLSGDKEIRVRGATGSGYAYKPDVGSGYTSGIRTHSFVLLPNVKVYGQYIGGAGGNADTRDPAYLTILSGDIGAANDYSDNSYHVVTATDSGIDTSNCLLDGFTITRGNGSQYGGGGVFIVDAAPRIDRCIITDNRAGSAETEEDLEDEEDKTVTNSYGAGVQMSHSAGVLTRCTITDNLNNSGTAIYGGGIVIQFGPVSPEPAFSSRIIDCTISGNRAGRGGGIAIKTGATGLLTNCLIVSNSTTGDGQNVTPWGGGISIDRSADSALVNCTISANSASRGGGIAQFGGSTNDSTVQNCIVWSNTASTSGPEIYFSSDPGSMTIAYSDIRDRNGSGVVGSPSYGSGVIGENTTAHNPNFVGGGSYQLNCFSACINAGNPTVSSVIPADVFNLDGDGSTTEPAPDLLLANRVQGNPAIPDMGAYEKPYSAVACPGEANADGCVGVADLLAVISTWGACGSPCPTDIMPQPCGNGQVNVNDLLTVIGNWGCGCTDGPPRIENVEDCMELCSGLYDWGSEDWCKCVNACAAQFEE